jgi:hypothetical protein
VSEKPSILATADTLIDEVAADGLAAGVVVQDGKVGAEVTAKRDIGKPGGWTLGAVARFRKGKGADGAAVLRWTPKG